MAGKRIHAEQKRVCGKKYGSDADSDPVMEEKGLKRVNPQKEQDKSSRVEKKPVEVLQNERETRFPRVRTPFADWFNPAARRREEICPVVCFSVVIAGRAKSKRRPEDK